MGGDGGVGASALDQAALPDLEAFRSGFPTMEQARAFFITCGLVPEDDGLLRYNAELDESELDHKIEHRLRDWNVFTTDFPGISLPTEGVFYAKMLLMLSIWRQREGGEIKYLVGGGAGVECALRGDIVGRVKRVSAPAFTKRDELGIYAAVDIDKRSRWVPYPRAFDAIFGHHECLPPERMKHLRCPLSGPGTEETDHTLQVYDTVRLDGVEVLVPQLELQFADLLLDEKITDAYLLARMYRLDSSLIGTYLRKYYIQLKLDERKNEVSERMETIQYRIARYRIQNPSVTDLHQWCAGVNAMLRDWYPDWQDFEPGDISPEGEFINVEFRDILQLRLEAKHMREVDRIRQFAELAQKVLEIAEASVGTVTAPPGVQEDASL